MPRAPTWTLAATFVAAFVVAFALAAASDRPAAREPAAAREPLPPGEPIAVPLRGAGLFGRDLAMAGTLHRPPGPGPFPVVVFLHGRAPDAADRARLDVGIGGAQLRYWLARGDAVVAPIRPGYGATGGDDAENAGVQFDGAGRCRSVPDYRAVAAAQRRSVEATLAWLREQPWADARRVLLVGQSAGGMAAVVGGAAAPDGVVGVVNFAGGTGGNPTLSRGRSCDPDQLGRLYGELGRTTRVPSLWIYARNDQFFGADAPVAWHAAFAQGGSRSTFVHAPAVSDGDGHGLSRHPRALWAPDVDAFLAPLAFDAAPPPLR
jgi:dienelactone hydrolase